MIPAINERGSPTRPNAFDRYRYVVAGELESSKQLFGRFVFTIYIRGNQVSFSDVSVSLNFALSTLYPSHHGSSVTFFV